MALTSPLQQWYIKKFVGMNNKHEDESQSPESAAILAQNLRYEKEPNTIIKRDPLTYYNDVVTGVDKPYKSIYRFYTDEGETKLLGINYTSLMVGNDTTGVMTAIRTNLTENKRASFLTYKGLAIGSNGYDYPFCYDGSSDNVTWELGACKVVDGGDPDAWAVDTNYTGQSGLTSGDWVTDGGTTYYCKADHISGPQAAFVTGNSPIFTGADFDTLKVTIDSVVTYVTLTASEDTTAKVATAINTATGGSEATTDGSSFLVITSTTTGASSNVTVEDADAAQTITLTNAGTGYSDNVGVATTGGTGTGLTVDITQTAGVIDTVVINAPGYGYTATDVITITTGNGDATFTVDTLNVVAADLFASAVTTDVGTNITTADGSFWAEANTLYDYKITMDDDAYICGTVSNTIASTSGEVELSFIPLGPAGTVNRKIYRRDSTTGGAWKLAATIANNTATTWTDTVGDISTQADMPAVTDEMPKGNLLTLHRERLFISGDPNNPSRIYYSNPYLPGYIQQTTNVDYMDVFPDESDEIIGIPVFMDVMLCFKRDTIRKIHIQTATSGASPGSWYASDVVSWQGCPAKWSIVKTIYGIVYLGWDHWYMWDGSNSNPIIDEFDTDEILDTDYKDTVSHWHNGTLYASYTDATTANQYHDKLMLYNFRRKAMSMDTVYVDSFTSYSGGDDANELFYGSSKEGWIFYAERSNRVIRLKRKTELELATLDDVFVGGVEKDPWIEVGRDVVIDSLTVANDQCWDGIGTEYPENIGAVAGSIDDLKGTINQNDTTGTYTYPSMEINANVLSLLSWNLSRHHPDDVVQFYIRLGADQAACEVASWEGPYTDPNGSDISAVTGNVWFQFKIEMTSNSTAGSPRIYFTDGYVIKITYTKGGTEAETSVEFIYDFGYRNFDTPFIDKIFKRIVARYVGDEGLLGIDWETEHSSGTFSIDLSTNPNKWSSYFPSDCMGERMRLRVYKDDLYDFKMKELKGLYTPEPIIV